MNISPIKTIGSWRDVADAARTTIGMEAGEGEPSSNWKYRILLAEHSPIRKLNFNWIWFDLKYWISVHFVRHKFGIEHWVKSQRPDRSSTKDRDNSPQSALINHECFANAQAIINISRKRLCKCAMPETRDAWITFLIELAKTQPELFNACVPDCIYRGWCYEYKSCGYHLTNKFQKDLAAYRGNINAKQP
jgi:hypothetical protein